MGSCCSQGDDEKDEKFTKGGKNDLSTGPIENRGCTDIIWIPIFIAAQVVFIIVTIAGMADGNPTKLYAPRDFSGAYCGVEVNWNNGPNLANTPSLSFTMNVTSTVDLMMKQLVCSTAAREALVEGGNSFGPLITDPEEQDKYLCDCCLTPCDACDGAIDAGGDLTSGDLNSVISGKLGELTNFANAGSLFSTGGANAETFSTTSFWNEATKWFNQVCLPSCDTDYTAISSNASSHRSYTYVPAKDDKLYGVWTLLKTSSSSNPMSSFIKDTIQSSFTFKALPFATCPYDEQFCVPFPGLTFAATAGSGDYCTFSMAAEVIDAIGGIAASAFESLGGTAISSAAIEEFGKWAGDFQKTLDTFIVVSILAFVIGLIFLVVLRFTIGLCVWIAVAMTVLMFAFGGGFIFTLSVQCSGADLFETGIQTTVAVVIAGTTTIHQAVTGVEVSEEMTGDGTDYRGIQRITKLGLKCLEWDKQERLPLGTGKAYYNSTNYPEADLIKSYCRNPYNADDSNKASTIWCVTSDPDIPWQECLPIGVIAPECEHGYEISTQEMRDALYYSSFVIWVLGIVWIVVIACFVKRINLAIALNKVAAVFLGMNPHILLVPIVQAFVGIIWVVIWMYGASYLLSQVPETYTPAGFYETYAEAYGTAGDCTVWDTIQGTNCTAGVPGACTDQWPTGAVWKDNICEEVDGLTKCWRCSQPRYALDVRFAISFFVFLWNNAFNVALGQILVAMAVAVWFFKPEEDKGKTTVVPRAVKTVFRYHVGSVAMGSFIVALVEFIRYLMKYFEKQAEAQKNKIMVYILKCVQCCIWCFEKCIKFLNKNAYIQIALLGKNFCTSAKAAFFLIARNFLRFGTIAALSGIIHGIGFVCIMAGTSVVGFFLVKEMHPDTSPFMPVICFMFVSYVVAKLFMNVFGLAVDTALQCFIATEEMDGDKSFVPSVLKDFVDTESSK